MKNILILLIFCARILSAADFKILENEILTTKLIDQAWSNRQSISNQMTIGNYLMNRPIVPHDYETAWKTARMVYFIGNFGYGLDNFGRSSDGVSFFDYGVSAAKIAIAINPNGVEGQYWFAVDLGSYGLAKGVFAASKIAGLGIEALKKSSGIDPAYQNYGSSRILGRYYYELPRLMGGSNSKALNYLNEATQYAPQYRANWIFLGNYYLGNSDYKNALNCCQRAINIPPTDGKFEEIRFLKEANECINKAKSKMNLP